MHVRVGVGDDHEPMPGARESNVELLGLAAVDGVAQHAEASVAGRRLDRRRLGVVGGAVIEDQHLELRVVGVQRRPYAGGDHRLLVVGGNQDAHPGPAALGLQHRIAGALLPQPEHEAAGDPERRGGRRGRSRRMRAARQARSAYRRSSRRRPSRSRLSTTAAKTNDAAVSSSPSSIASVRSSSQEATSSATTHRIGPNTSAAISFGPDAGRIGRKGWSNPWASSGLGKLGRDDPPDGSREQPSASAALPARTAAGPSGEPGGEGGDPGGAPVP